VLGRDRCDEPVVGRATGYASLDKIRNKGVAACRAQRKMVTSETFAEELGHEFGWGPMRWRQACEYRVCLQSTLRYEHRIVVDGQAGDLMMLMPRREARNDNARVDRR
jgi:hypothetical protein